MRTMRRLTIDAERGDAQSQFNLGMLFDSRLDDNYHATAGNREEAIKWLLRAARQGLARAQTKLAEIYAERPSSHEDIVRAYAWFLVSAGNTEGAQRHKSQSGLDRIAVRLDSLQLARASGLARALTAEIGSELA